jgi:hypothetical protein
MNLVSETGSNYGREKPSLLGHLERANFNHCTTDIEVEVNLRPTVSRLVCPGVRRPSGTHDQFFFLLEISFRHRRVCYFVAPSDERTGL